MQKGLLFMSHVYEPWGALAISFLILSIFLLALGIFIGTKIKDNDKTFSRILLGFGILFLCFEFIHEYGRYQEFNSYDWSSFQFQICSVSMYLSLIVPFIKKGRVKKSFIMFIATFTTLSGILPLVFAQGNLLRWPTLMGILFSFVWHILLIFVGSITIGYIDLGRSFKKEYKYLIGTFVIFFAITCIAQLLNVSIHYLAPGFSVGENVIKEVGYIPNYELDPDSVSLFYISPYFKSNIPVVFDTVWLNYGWVACWGLYLLAFQFGAFLVYFVNFICKKIEFIILKKKNYIRIN